MVWVNLKCSVIRKQPVEVGQCFRRGEMALLISSTLGKNEGFGNLNGEFWLGLDKIHRLTVSGGYKLRIDLEDIHGKTAFAEYSSFSVTSERAKYQLHEFGKLFRLVNFHRLNQESVGEKKNAAKQEKQN